MDGGSPDALVKRQTQRTNEDPCPAAVPNLPTHLPASGLWGVSHRPQLLLSEPLGIEEARQIVGSSLYPPELQSSRGEGHL